MKRSKVMAAKVVEDGLLMLDPSDVQIVGYDTEADESHPLWDADASAPVNKNLAANIAEHGQLQPIVVTQADDKTFLCVVGRDRVKAMRHLQLKDEKIRVKATVRKADDLSQLRALYSENFVRKGMSPRSYAEAAVRLKTAGIAQKSIAVDLNCSPQSVGLYLKWEKLTPEVRAAVEADQISFSMAIIWADYDAEKQNRELEITLKKIATAEKPPTVRSAKESSGNGGEESTSLGKRLLNSVLDAQNTVENEVDGNVFLGIALALGRVDSGEIDGMNALLKTLREEPDVAAQSKATAKAAAKAEKLAAKEARKREIAEARIAARQIVDNAKKKAGVVYQNTEQ